MSGAETLLLVGVTAAIGGAVAAVAGFGIGSVLTPLLMVWMPAPHAVAIVAIPHTVATLLRWLHLRSAVHLATFVHFGIASGIGGLGGAFLQPHLETRALTVTLGVLIAAAGVAELARRRLPLPGTPGWRFAGGVLSGMFGGLVGNQGGIRSAALLGFGLTQAQLVATATATALIVDAARLPVYLVRTHAAIGDAAPLWLAATAGVVVGTFVGVPILKRLPEPAFRRALGVLLLALGVALILGIV